MQRTPCAHVRRPTKAPGTRRRPTTNERGPRSCRTGGVAAAELLERPCHFLLSVGLGERWHVAPKILLVSVPGLRNIRRHLPAVGIEPHRVLVLAQYRKLGTVHRT